MAENIVSSVGNTDGSNRVRSNWRQLGVHNYIRIMIIGGLFCCLFRSEIESIVYKWFTDSSWSHGFLIPLFSLYFLNQRKEEILNLHYVKDPLVSLFRGQRSPRLLSGQTRANYLGFLFLVLVFLFFLFNVVSPSGYGYFRPISMIAAIGAVVLFLGGWSLVKYTWLPIAFLVFAVPLPDRYYASLTMPMRLLSAKVTVVLLNLVNGLDATANGVVIDVIYKGQKLEPSLDVAEACSGMRLLMAFLALGVAMAYLHYRPVWQRIILLFSTVPIAMFCNIVRVTVTGFIYILINPGYAQGIYHDILGLMMLPLAFGLYGLLAWFMSSLFIEQTGAAAENVIVRKRKSSNRI